MNVQYYFWVSLVGSFLLMFRIRNIMYLYMDCKDHSFVSVYPRPPSSTIESLTFVPPSSTSEPLLFHSKEERSKIRPWLTSLPLSLIRCPQPSHGIIEKSYSQIFSLPSFNNYNFLFPLVFSRSRSFLWGLSQMGLEIDQDLFRSSSEFPRSISVFQTFL